VAGANFGPLGEHTYYLDLSQGSVNYYYANGQAIAQRITSILEDETHLYYLHHDYLGNLTEVTDENQQIVGRARYDAYGRVLSNTIPLTLTQRLYAGALYDPDTGLYKIGARWYDPDIGLWLTPDSVVPDIYNPIAWNPYAFNYDNPVNYVDPSGHFPIPAGLLLLAATGFLGGEIYATAQGYNALDREFWQYSLEGAVGLTFAYFAVADVAFMAGAGLQGAGLWAGSTRLFGWGMRASGAGAALYAWAFQPLRSRQDSYGVGGGGEWWDDDCIGSAKSARNYLGRVPPGKTVAAVEGGPRTLSGWSSRKGFVQATNSVMVQARRMRYTLPISRMRDQGVPGRFYASHAEKQLSVVAPNRPMAVSRAMCPDCIRYFQTLAQYRGVTQVVADPTGVRVFLTSGKMILIP
jgi:RHS repeat-associated protein